MSDGNKVWQPVADGPAHRTRLVRGWARVGTDGDLLWMESRDESVSIELPPDIRLCRLVDATPAYPEPDWATAPDGAEWYAVSPERVAFGMPTANAFWFSHEPVPVNGRWERGIGEVSWRQPAKRVPLPLGCDWRLTLRRRPEVQP